MYRSHTSYKVNRDVHHHQGLVLLRGKTSTHSIFYFIPSAVLLKACWPNIHPPNPRSENTQAKIPDKSPSSLSKLDVCNAFRTLPGLREDADGGIIRSFVPANVWELVVHTHKLKPSDKVCIRANSTVKHDPRICYVACPVVSFSVRGSHWNGE